MPQAFQFEILRPDGPPTSCELPFGSYTLGRGEGCRLRLRHGEVSERHALLSLRPDAAFIEDLGSSNGTRLNGETVARPARLAPGDRIGIGPFTLRLTGAPEAARPLPAAGPPVPTPQPRPRPPAPMPEPAPMPPAALPPEPVPSPPPPRDPALAVRREIKNQIHRELVQRLDIKRLTAARINSEELQRRARETLGAVIADVRQRLPPGVDPDRLGEEIFNEALRLGPLEDYLSDESITEIMVNGAHQVYVERAGRLELTTQDFMDDASVLAIIERIVSPIGRRIDESQPYVDARLPDGSRVNAIIPPLSLIGPCVTIRKFSKTPFTDADLVRFGTLTPDMAEFLKVCVRMRKNIVVAGGTGSGKTTLLNVLSAYIPEHERILTIEDAAELRLGQPHLLRLEARPPNIEGRGAITIRDLVRNALRMRPDRIIVGECRGGEALDMLQAMNTGHDGSLTTVHANSPRDVVSRLETMVLMAGIDLPSRAIREQISSAVDMIVHESRFSDGSRRITHICEIVGLEGNQTVMQDIFEFRQTGIGENGRVLGSYRPTGAVPTFFEHIKARGLSIDPVMFQPGHEAAGSASS